MQHILFYGCCTDGQISVIQIAYAVKDARFESICCNLVHMYTVTCTGHRLSLSFLEHGWPFEIQKVQVLA